ncbi:unnamed protein product [Heterobilharzia americana]|nr:unnamed protein product [Heterobilharzia americana]CAH8500597.1 unnamed protein product [Heterobilharzia americana]
MISSFSITVLFVTCLFSNLNGFPTDEYASNTYPAETCLEPIKTGPCVAHFIAYAYSVQLNRCVPFLYGGCLGTRNRFDTEYDCMETCAPYLNRDKYTNNKQFNN